VTLADFEMNSNSLFNLVIADNSLPYFKASVEKELTASAYQKTLFSFPPAADLDTFQTIACSFVERTSNKKPDFIIVS